MVAGHRVGPEEAHHEIAPELQELLLRHPGRWAAITRTTLIAVRDTPEEAYAAARQQGIEAPILYHVPDNRQRTYYY